MQLTNWKEREFLIEANKLNLKGLAKCRFSLQGVKAMGNPGRDIGESQWQK